MANVQALENFINGRFMPCTRHVDSYNPTTGEVHRQVSDSSAEQVEPAIQAAKKAFTTWSKLPAKERGKILNKIADRPGYCC